MNDKANTLKQCGFGAAMVNILKRGFCERGTSDAAPRSRHQKKALYFQTEYPKREHPASGEEEAGVPAVCWGSGGGPCREDSASCRRGGSGGGGYLCLESIHSDACVHFFAFIDLVKNHPAFLWFSDTSFHLPFQRVTACCLLAALRLQHTHRKNYEIFLWMDMGHWNVALPTTDKINRDRSDCQISTKLSRCDCFWLLIYISACFFSSLFLPTVLFTSLLLIERRRAVGPLGSDPGRSRGTVKWRLRGSSRDRGECRVHQGRGREQLVPANDCAW